MSKKKKMPSRKVGGVYVCDMDSYLLSILKEERRKLKYYYSLRHVNNVDYDFDYFEDLVDKINTVEYFIEKNKNKIKKNKQIKRNK